MSLHYLTRRIAECFPAFLSWGTLLFPALLLSIFPNIVFAFVLLYVFLWFLRAVEYAFFLIYAYREYRKNLKRNWTKELKEVSHSLYDITPDEVIHLILVPTYKESVDVLRDTMNAIADSHFPKEQIFVCLATEERDAKNGRNNAHVLTEEYKGVFGRFFWVEHPDGLPNEIKGKGGNISFAGRALSKTLSAEGIDFTRVLVTTLDADNRIHHDLLSALTKAYCESPKRHQQAFQPIPLFFNNIWDVPAINRIVAFSSGYWHLIEAGRPDRLRNFSSHSQPLSALAAMDFWDTTTIVEDGRQYWRSYFHFHGAYEVIPIFLPIYQDAVLGKNYFRSLAGQFQQLKRWSWGCSDIAYCFTNIRKEWKHLPKWKTFLQYFRLIEGHYMWATAALFLAIVIPAVKLFAPEVSETVFGTHVALFLSVIFRLALGGIFVSMILTFLMAPKPPKKIRTFDLIWQWALIPITTIFFGSLPALVTQTQIAFGKRMEFNVTEKIRQS